LDDRSVEGPSAEIVDEELPVLERRVSPLAVGHRRHRGGDRFLHQTHTPDSRDLSGAHRGLALHLVEGGGNGDHGSFEIELADRQLRLREQGLEHFGACVFRAHGTGRALEFDRTGSPHQALELRADVLRRKGVLLVGPLADEHAASAVDHDRAGKNVGPVDGLEEAELAPVVADDGRVGCSEIDTEIHDHSLLAR
jgi:hypothetical protein